jgi:hypothetical protein
VENFEFESQYSYQLNYVHEDIYMSLLIKMNVKFIVQHSSIKIVYVNIGNSYEIQTKMSTFKSIKGLTNLNRRHGDIFAIKLKTIYLLCWSRHFFLKRLILVFKACFVIDQIPRQLFWRIVVYLCWIFCILPLQRDSDSLQL